MHFMLNTSMQLCSFILYMQIILKLKWHIFECVFDFDGMVLKIHSCHSNPPLYEVLESVIRGYCFVFQE